MRLGLRWKWVMGHLLIGGVVLFFMMMYLSLRMEAFFADRFENRWRRELQLTRELVKSRGFQSLTYESADSLADHIGAILGMRVTLIDLQGRVLGDTNVGLPDLPAVENHGSRPEVLQALSEGFGKSQRVSATVNFDLLYLAMPAGTIDNPGGIVRVAVPFSDIDASISEINRLVWLAGGAGMIMVILIGFVTSRSMINRLNELSESAKRFAKGDFSKKVVTNKNDELADLGRALNQTADDLKSYVSQITEERDQLQTILNSMVEGVVVTDMRGNIIVSNPAFKEIFQLSEPVLDHSTSEVFRKTELLQSLEKAKSEKRDLVVALDSVGPARKSLEAHIAILGSKTSPSGTVIVFHDITQIQHLEKVRRDFIANVSHEIRTPVTAIKGYVETILENGELGREQIGDFLQTIHRNTDRMAKLVDDLLRLSRLESIEEMPIQKLDLAEIIHRITDNFQTILDSKEIQLELHIPDRLPGVNGNSAELETVLECLIDNASKYGAAGKYIEVVVSEQNLEVRVDISDRGIGIPADDQPRIFERFYRVDKARSRALGGTGLGLSIVKHIIQRHGGRVWVKSEAGEGSTFSFTIPKA